jgi:uncharacterized protein
MSSTYTYPGVYIQELPSPVHPITGVATSITAFVGYTARGIDNRAQAIYSFSDYQRLYGGLASNSEVSYAVQQFFQNNGSQAYVVRTPLNYPAGSNLYAAVGIGSAGVAQLIFTALSSGQWANGQLLIDVDVQGLNLNATTGGDPLAFNLTTTNLVDGTTEYFPAITLNSAYRNYVLAVVNDPDNGSQLVNASLPSPAPTTPTALEVTGVVGAAITIAGAGSVNALLGNNTNPAPTSATVTADAYLILTINGSTSATPNASMYVKVLGKGSTIAQTVQGLASQLQQAVNNVLTVSVPGASVVCSAAPVGSGSGIRVNVSIPNQSDATVTFETPTSAVTPAPSGTLPAGAIDAATPLGLVAPSNTNVAHYVLGSTTTVPSGGEITSAQASAPTAAPNSLPHSEDLIGDPLAFTGIYALTKVPIFNLLSIPEAARATPGDPQALDPNINPVEIYSAALTLCSQSRAMLLVDPRPDILTVAGAVDWISGTLPGLGPNGANGAAYWPQLRLADQLNNGQLRTFSPSGVVAGVITNTDTTRGVWKAPAGIGAVLSGVQSMTYNMSNTENGVLNPLGLNCFRTFPVYGPVVWGARTLVGADAAANQWKYIPVRRVALFLESSLYQGTQWVVFEPNDEPLWSAIRLNVGSFMQELFIKGYFQGQTPQQAYFVKCDSETTTQTDIDNGVVNIIVGFAPLVPAEFVVIQIQQIAGSTSN